MDETTCESPRKKFLSSESERRHDNDYVTSTVSPADPAIRELPQKTSEWIGVHLSQIHVTVDGSVTSPLCVFTCEYTDFLRNNDTHTLPEVIADIYGSRDPELSAKYHCCIKACTDVFTMDADSIFNVPKQQLQELIVELRKPFRETAFGKWMKKWKKLYIVGKNETIKDFIADACGSIHGRLQDFCEQLLYMVRSDNTDVTEGIEHENFWSSDPVITIGNQNIISVPDALIYQAAKKLSSKEEIVAVVKVTIAFLSVGEEYYRNLKEGSLQKLSSVKYSRPYNYLHKRERENFIKTFVDMGVLSDNLQ
ncbi:uncharacterized protein LOC125673048 isoform X2 [Ostrea edulis]|uniref:uncharacterized protein LOC125673048 isoform X2 n=1 Tax=Ostrea edulis TaxID=37623 RepID=UPI0024AFF97B|nr:uncharacterized protein LOC125673048 isoform X2 [Ostrea edulis]